MFKSQTNSTQSKPNNGLNGTSKSKFSAKKPHVSLKKSKLSTKKAQNNRFLADLSKHSFSTSTFSSKLPTPTHHSDINAINPFPVTPLGSIKHVNQSRSFQNTKTLKIDLQKSAYSNPPTTPFRPITKPSFIHPLSQSASFSTLITSPSPKKTTQHSSKPNSTNPQNAPKTPTNLTELTKIKSKPTHSSRIHAKRTFRSTIRKLAGSAPKLSPVLDREALSRGEYVEMLTFSQTLKKLTPYLWPKNDIGTKVRVVSALSCLILSKILNVGVPVLFKEAIDELTEKIPTLQTVKSKKLAAEKNVENFTENNTDKIAEKIASEPLTEPQSRWIDSFLDFLQSPDFLSISTTQLPFAVLTAWGLVRLVASLTNELKNALFTRISNIATTSIAVDLLNHLMHMDPAFHLDRNTGSISRAIDRGNKSIGLALSMITFRVIPTLFEMGLVVGVLASTCGPQFSSVAIATLVAYIVYTVGVTQWRIKFKQQMNKASNTASAVAFDALMNVETVQRFNNQDMEKSKYKTAWENYGDSQVKNEASLALLNWGQGAIFTVGLTSVMLLAAQGVQEGTLTVGDLVLANALLLQLSLPLNIVGTVYRELKQSVLDMQTMFALRQTQSQIVNIENPVDFTPRLQALQELNNKEIIIKKKKVHKIDEKTPIPPSLDQSSESISETDSALESSSETESPVSTPPPHLSTTGGFSIDLDHVQFHYSSTKDKNLLQDVSVHVPAGTSIAFVGGSGSGKSTVLKLASRHFDVTGGQISIDNVPIKNIELTSLRNTIGVVPQEAILFNDTIMANIRYAKPDATDDEVINAAKLSQIHDSISEMKDGYNTLVGERGLKISGGQKQRISIARVMLLNPPIVMCDEATSALDSQTEYEIMQNLRRLTKESKKTCVYVAHRLSTVTHCDQIAVIEDGKIVERGTHHQLLKFKKDLFDDNNNIIGTAPGRYATLWHLQSTVDHHLLDGKSLKELTAKM
jgi:ABC-type transport system involved in Fe-S cluster assembly fused permease/ATPase subunit